MYHAPSRVIALVTLLVVTNHVHSYEHIDGLCLPVKDATELKIACNQDQRLAVHEAYTTTASGDRECPFLAPTGDHKWNPYQYQQPCKDDIRLSLNRKCSGFSNCTFSIRDDHLSKCSGLAGHLVVRYACVDKQRYHKFCNLRLTDQYGYVATPGNSECVLV